MRTHSISTIQAGTCRCSALSPTTCATLEGPGRWAARGGRWGEPRNQRASWAPAFLPQASPWPSWLAARACGARARLPAGAAATAEVAPCWWPRRRLLPLGGCAPVVWPSSEPDRPILTMCVFRDPTPAGQLGVGVANKLPGLRPRRLPVPEEPNLRRQDHVSSTHGCTFGSDRLG